MGGFRNFKTSLQVQLAIWNFMIMIMIIIVFKVFEAEKPVQLFNCIQ